MSSSYSGDPYRLTARFAGTCKGCGETFERGADVFYYPKGKHTFVGPCADQEEQSFNSAVQDEDMYGGGYV